MPSGSKGMIIFVGGMLAIWAVLAWRSKQNAVKWKMAGPPPNQD